MQDHPPRSLPQAYNERSGDGSVGYEDGRGAEEVVSYLHLLCNVVLPMSVGVPSVNVDKSQK